MRASTLYIVHSDIGKVSATQVKQRGWNLKHVYNLHPLCATATAGPNHIQYTLCIDENKMMNLLQNMLHF